MPSELKKKLRRRVLVSGHAASRRDTAMEAEASMMKSAVSNFDLTAASVDGSLERTSAVRWPDCSGYLFIPSMKRARAAALERPTSARGSTWRGTLWGRR